jgi:hypothetical protein
MDRLKTWAFRLGCAAVTAGALLSRDACLGGSHPPPPDPKQTPSAGSGAPTAAATNAPAAPPATAAPTGTGTFASPP